MLINEHGTLKLADFGLARVFRLNNNNKGERPYSPQVASRWYRAPELLYGSSNYGPSVDLWAAGCVFAEMLRGLPLFAVRYKYMELIS